MNRIDRLFAIILLMQARKKVTARQIADYFEITERTVYRDMSALLQMGVPVQSIPGKGYELLEGYFLPPLLFKPEEARALFLGGQLLMSHTSGKLPLQVRQALDRLFAILPSALQEEMTVLTEILGFEEAPARFDLDDPHLSAIQKAIRSKQVIEIHYHHLDREEISIRQVEPLRLSYWYDNWYLTAFCRLRQDQRYFRLNRIQKLAVLKQRFQPRPYKDAVVEDWIEVRIRFSPSVLNWVREQQYPGFEREETIPGDERAIMVYRTRPDSALVSWIMGWGRHAEVLSPLDLRQRIRREAYELLTLLT